jgi:hypothetical protein
LVLAISVLSALVGFLVAAVIAVIIWTARSRLRPGPPTQVPQPELPDWFYWLADAPMFIDTALVSSFYDAVLRPDYRITGIEVSKEEESSVTTKSSFGVKAAEVIPGLELAAGSETSATESTKRGESRTLIPIQNAPRELVKLALHYLERFAGEDDTRIWAELTVPVDRPWESPSRERIESRPRMLAFIDFPRGTRFVPMAVETDEGVTAVYETLIKSLRAEDGLACPEYPDNPEVSDFAERSNAYWQWFADNWSATKALVALEEAVKGNKGRLRWVNYRVPVQDGLTLHLNVVGHGSYDTGIFAYNLIKRGWRQGLRVVGTVRAEPGLNVLAIYDK